MWRNYIETTEAIRTWLARQMQEDSGLSLGDYAVLLALTEAPDNRYRPSELADQINWERSRLSHHLRRMEKRGLIRRVDCAEDNRGARVIITEQGTAAYRASSIPHLQEIRRVFAQALTPEQLDQLATITSQLRANLENRVHPETSVD